MEMIFTAPTAQEYIALRARTGMSQKAINNSEIALRNSLFIVSLWEKEKLIGFGRVVGDRGITFIVSDIMVDPDYQRQGFGKLIMKEIDRYLEENTDDSAYVCLIADKPADKLYSQFGFVHTEPNSCGMKRIKS